MAGTIPLSMTQQFDEFGKPLSGGLLYIIQAGTVNTLQQPYQDAGLTIVQPNPIPLDTAGRVPQFFLADGYIKIRLTDKLGNTQLARDGVLVIGPSAGGGGGGPGVDPTTLIQTGMLALFYGIGVLSGYVRSNGRTIGNAGSGATERANADTQALWIFLYGADPNLVVSGGRTGNALNDYNAGKQLTLPDYRGRAIAGLDDMGNAAAGRLTATWFGTSAIVLGAAGGLESRALTNINQVPEHDHAVFLKEVAHTHNLNSNATGSTASKVFIEGAGNGIVGGGGAFGPQNTLNIVTALTNISVGSVSGVANDNKVAKAGAVTPAAFAAVSPAMLCTIYLKL